MDKNKKYDILITRATQIDGTVYDAGTKLANVSSQVAATLVGAGKARVRTKEEVSSDAKKEGKTDAKK